MDKPILFNGQMVNALLDGRKTQTRRVIKSKDLLDLINNLKGATGLASTYTTDLPIRANIGDRLWVREAWRADRGLDLHSGSEIEQLCVEEAGYDHCWAAVFYEANETWSRREAGTVGGRYRHARFMPRWASRLTLIVTDVRVQRVQDIRANDAEDEGVAHSDGYWHDYLRRTFDLSSPRSSFKSLWNDINAKPKPVGGKIITHYESYPSSGIARTETYRGKPHIITPNPWVAAYTFTVHKTNIDQAAPMEAQANDQS